MRSRSDRSWPEAPLTQMSYADSFKRAPSKSRPSSGKRRKSSVRRSADCLTPDWLLYTRAGRLHRGEVQRKHFASHAYSGSVFLAFLVQGGGDAGRRQILAQLLDVLLGENIAVVGVM